MTKMAIWIAVAPLALLVFLLVWRSLAAAPSWYAAATGRWDHYAPLLVRTTQLVWTCHLFQQIDNWYAKGYKYHPQ